MFSVARLLVVSIEVVLLMPPTLSHYLHEPLNSRPYTTSPKL